MSETVYDQDVEVEVPGWPEMFQRALNVARTYETMYDELEERCREELTIMFLLGLLAGCILMMLLVLVVGS